MTCLPPAGISVICYIPALLLNILPLREAAADLDVDLDLTVRSRQLALDSACLKTALDQPPSYATDRTGVDTLSSKGH